MQKRTKKLLFLLCILLSVFGVREICEALEGTIGTRFTITGSGFGIQKPKVYLEYEQTPGQIKKITAKVENWSDTSLICLWTKKLTPGTYNLFVQPKDKNNPILLGTLSIMSPTIDMVTPGYGSVGDIIVMQGKFFSTKKPKVYLEDPVSLKRKSCKVLSSTMDPETGESSLQFKVPKWISSYYNLILKNQIAETKTYPFVWSPEKITDLMEGAESPPSDTATETTTIQYITEEGTPVEIEAVKGQIIILFKLTIPASTAESTVVSNGGSVIAKIPAIRYYLVGVASGSEMQFIEKMRQDPNVIYAIPHIPLKPQQANLQPNEWNYYSSDSSGNFNWYHKEINDPLAWSLVNKSLVSEIEIGIIESSYYGLSEGSEDFVGRLLNMPSFPILDDHDDAIHGTIVTALAAAEGNNDFGNVGVNWWSKIRLLSQSKSLYLYDLLKAVSEGSDVVNISIASGDGDGSCDTNLIVNNETFTKFIEDQSLFELINALNVVKPNFLVVKAAGNDNCLHLSGKFFKPSNLIIVGASNKNGGKSSFSDYGGHFIDIAAPGEDIGFIDYSLSKLGQAYLTTEGTSFSTPLVTGAAALVWGNEPNLTPRQVIKRLKDTANPFRDVYPDGEFGSGILDVSRALDPFLPTAPTGLSATAVSSNQIDLSWNPSPDNIRVEGYKIYRNGSYLKSVTTTSTSDTGLNPNTQYCYTVSAYDAAGNESGQSRQACATTLSAGPGAGIVNLPKTGQTKCYDIFWGREIDCAGTGQDGEHQAGVSWPSPRFTITYCDATGPCNNQSSDCDGNPSTDVVTDNLTGLTWARDGNLPKGKEILWHKALDDVNNLTLCGYSDWRLPNINELQSLVHVGYAEEDCGGFACSAFAVWLNYKGFQNVVSDCYWSSTAYSNYYDSHIFSINIENGENGSIYNCSEYGDYVWPVRAGQTDGKPDPNFPANVRKTGQTKCYGNLLVEINCAGTGQDGEHQAGVSWPSPRFTDNGDGTVTDNLTGLMWLMDADCFGSYTFNAPDIVADFNSHPTKYNCLYYTTNYTDWRLPNYKELLSLIDYSQKSPSLPLGHPFVHLSHNDYISSTYSYNTMYYNSWDVYIWSGYYCLGCGYAHRIWPVRGGLVDNK